MFSVFAVKFRMINDAATDGAVWVEAGANSKRRYCYGPKSEECVMSLLPPHPAVPSRLGRSIGYLARSPAGMCGPLLHSPTPHAEHLPDQGPHELINPPHSSTTPPRHSTTPAHRYPTPPPSWQHCPRVRSPSPCVKHLWHDFPRWALTVDASRARPSRFPLSSSSPVRNEIKY